jgi:beta-N-acetylhexosaminidase
MNGPLLIDIAGTALTDIDRQLLKHPAVGGMILFARNIVSPSQVMDLVKEIRSVSPDLLISVDQEGGRVQRLIQGFTRLPPLANLGALYDKDPDAALQSAQQLGWLMAAEVKAIGIDLSFAPVLDLNLNRNQVIGNRAFHSNPKIVSRLAREYCLGMKKAGMATVGKHFPGHGYVTLDSHHALPEDDRACEQVLADAQTFIDLMPYLTAIMPAHIIYHAFDKNPVTFSSHWLQTLLRQQFQYSGIVISDDLSMAGAKCYPSVIDAARCALSAGCDLLLVCNDRDAVDSLVEPVAGLPISLNRQTKIRQLQGDHFPNTWKHLRDSELWQSASDTLVTLQANSAA